MTTEDFSFYKPYLVYCKEDCSAFVRLVTVPTRTKAIEKLVEMKREYDASHGGGGDVDKLSEFERIVSEEGAVFYVSDCNKGTGSLWGIEPIHAVDDFSIHRNAVQQWIDDAHRIVVCCKKE